MPDDCARSLHELSTLQNFIADAIYVILTARVDVFNLPPFG